MLPEGAVKFGFYEVPTNSTVPLCETGRNICLTQMKASKRFFARLQGVSDPSKISISAQLASGGLGGIAAQCVPDTLSCLSLLPLDSLANSHWRSGLLLTRLIPFDSVCNAT